MFYICSIYNSEGEHGELCVLAWLFDTPSWWFRAIFSGDEKETAFEILVGGRGGGFMRLEVGSGRGTNVLRADDENFLELRASK